MSSPDNQKQLLLSVLLTSLSLAFLAYMDQSTIQQQVENYENVRREQFSNIVSKGDHNQIPNQMVKRNPAQKYFKEQQFQQTGPPQTYYPTQNPTQYPTQNPNQYPTYPTNPLFYGNAPYNSNKPYTDPKGNIPQNQDNVSLTASGSQALQYQMYQNAINAATPTSAQLDSISGQSPQQTGNTQFKGGVSSEYAPFDILSSGGPQIFDSEYQAVNYGNPRAEEISACAQNSPTFISTSLLPKATIPGQQSWNIGAPQNILASQNFLSASQQMGVDTVSSSLRNPSYDLRDNIPNPISVVGPWNQSTIEPDLERKNVSCFGNPGQGIYGCASSGGFNQNPTYVGM